MLLTFDYRTVRSRVAGAETRDFSGWITPNNKFLRHSGSHAGTLREHGVETLADRALNEGFIWMNQIGDTLHVELLGSQLLRAKRVLNDLLNKYVRKVNFELFTPSGKMVREIELDFIHGGLE
jgi:hypothetical protein